MRSPSEWVPMEWPSSWTDAARLKLLSGTAVNCLVMPSLAHEVAGAARAAGFDVVAPNDPAVVRIENAPWPGVQSGGTQGATAGPTGSPWVDSNGWQVRLARSRSASKPVWVSYAAAEDGVRPKYRLAVADAAWCGGRWLMSLERELREGLESGSAEARKAWAEINGTLKFFERHREWAAMEAVAKLAVISDFAGPNEMLGTEILNLAVRRHLAHRIVPKERAAEAPLEGLEAVLYVDEQPPDKVLLDKLAAFARSGGLLMAPRSTTALIADLGAAAERVERSSVYRYGKGRVATPINEWDDPYLLAMDAHLLMSRRHDPMRLFNAGLLMPYMAAARGGKRRVAQIVNFAGRESANFVTLAVPGPCRSARMWTIESDAAKPLQLRPEGEWVEMHLPAFRTYAAVELE